MKSKRSAKLLSLSLMVSVLFFLPCFSYVAKAEDQKAPNSVEGQAIVAFYRDLSTEQLSREEELSIESGIEQDAASIRRMF